MNRVRASLAATSLFFLLIPAASFAQNSDNASATAGSKIRIVRLSQTRGTVKVVWDDRPAEPAVNNLPIVEKMQLETALGVAEVEFEDNSTVRLAPDSAVDFPRLERTAGGGTLTSVRVTKGMVYVSLAKTPGNEFVLLAGKGSVRLMPASHVRVDLDGNKAQVAVLSGTVHIDTPNGSTEGVKKQSVAFDLQGSSTPAVERRVQSNAFDGWDKRSAEYHARVASMSMYGNSPYVYGASDMAYYGSFMNAAGCGTMWRPYFTSAAWEPYSNGAWAWYQGSGYSWVSPYPWGWIPYHYGSWSYCPGTGWGWMPGGSWNGLDNGPILKGIRGPGRLPPAPIRPPRVGEPTLRPVSLHPPVKSEMARDSTFVFRKDSAGLGVPREGFGNLAGFSRRTGTHGVASTPIYVDSGARPVVSGSQGMTAEIRAGMPPSALSPGPINVGVRPGSGGGGMSTMHPISAPVSQGGPVRAK